MKELSTEQKAKAYDKAKSIMKKYIESGNAGVIAENTIKKAFPELAESEDERVRKDLIIYLRSILSNKKYGDKFIENWIAWLEKLPIEKLPFEMKTPEESLGIDSETYSKVVDECIYGEQKPVEWSTNDLPEFESYLCLMFQKFRTKGVCTNGEIIDFVKEYSQKLKDTLCHVWSEKDDLLLDSCISLIEDIDCTKEEQNWLKSLKDRYTWKPSDEQMVAIQEAMNIVGVLTITGSKINSLYQDLRKLREE